MGIILLHRAVALFSGFIEQTCTIIGVKCARENIDNIPLQFISSYLQETRLQVQIPRNVW